LPDIFAQGYPNVNREMRDEGRKKGNAVSFFIKGEEDEPLRYALPFPLSSSLSCLAAFVTDFGLPYMNGLRNPERGRRGGSRGGEAF
jgi:hypothetical protein